MPASRSGTGTVTASTYWSGGVISPACQASPSDVGSPGGLPGRHRGSHASTGPGPFPDQPPGITACDRCLPWLTSVSVIYQDPLAYLLGLEGIALLDAWVGDHDRTFTEARLAEIRRLLDDENLRDRAVLAERVGTVIAYRDVLDGSRSVNRHRAVSGGHALEAALCAPGTGREVVGGLVPDAVSVRWRCRSGSARPSCCVSAWACPRRRPPRRCASAPAQPTATWPGRCRSSGPGPGRTDPAGSCPPQPPPVPAAAHRDLTSHAADRGQDSDRPRGPGRAGGAGQTAAESRGCPCRPGKRLLRRAPEGALIR